MTQNFRCPRCRSLIKLIGVTDYTAPQIQAINCPVCGQEWWIASDLPPQRWSTGQILERYEPNTPLVESAQEIPLSLQKPAENLSILEDIRSGIKTFGVWVVIVLVLVAVIMWKWKI